MKLNPYELQVIKPQQGIPWNIQQVNAPSFWPNSRGGGAVVAVVDTGIDSNHPELKGRILLTKNFTEEGLSGDSFDREGHGTHVAGTIAGANCGIGPELRIMALKVFGDSKVDENIIDAFNFIYHWNETCAPADNVVAVNCSFGAGYYDPRMAFAIRRLVNSGVAVVCAAGNSGDGNPDTSEVFSFPAYIHEVVTTGAVTKDGSIAIYSNSFDGVDLAAPGTDVYSCWPGGGYAILSGTSMATPHITGAIALIYDAWRRREGSYPTEEQAVGVLMKHVKASSLRKELVGAGILDLSWASKKWPLWRVQMGAYYNKSGAEATSKLVQQAGFQTYLTKY